MTKKVLCLVMVLLVTVTMMPYAAAQEETSVPTIEEILADYHAKTFAITTADASAAAYSRQAAPAQSKTMDTTQELANITNDTVNALNNAGYEAYNLNSNNLERVERALNSDLSLMGLDPDGSYIIVASGEEGVSPASSIGGTPANSFYYTYEGEQYLLRYLTVTAADDLLLGKASAVDLLTSHSTSFVQNCLDAAISFYFDALFAPIPVGTIASLFGLSVSNFANYSESTLYYNCGTNWTRIYTQVWSTYDQAWHLSSCVEYVTANSYLSGMYYDTSGNQYRPVESDFASESVDSEHCYDYTWRKEKAVLGYRLGQCFSDVVGGVTNTYQGRNVIRHEENM